MAPMFGTYAPSKLHFVPRGHLVNNGIQHGLQCLHNKSRGVQHCRCCNRARWSAPVVNNAATSLPQLVAGEELCDSRLLSELSVNFWVMSG